MCKAIEDMRNQERQEGFQEGMEQGEKSGKEKKMVEIALRMLSAGKYTPEEIADVSGLSLDTVHGLKAGATA